jgi:hypothetical protein
MSSTADDTEINGEDDTLLGMPADKKTDEPYDVADDDCLVIGLVAFLLCIVLLVGGMAVATWSHFLYFAAAAATASLVLAFTVLYT